MNTSVGVLPNWRQGAAPHKDIQQGKISEALFAVNLSRAIAREGTDEYRDPKLFFERTYLTRTLKSLIRDVLKVLNGEPVSNSVLHLQTNFGGGKTHAELAIYHLLNSREQVKQVPSVAALLQEIGVDDIPQAAVAVLPCADLYAGGRQAEEGLTINTLWGEIAYRLGGAKLYEIIRDSDQRCSTPGVDLLRNVLTQAGPHVILIDELLHYVDKAAAIMVGDSNLGSQTIGFLRELSEAVDSVDGSVLVASLTASRMEDITVLQGDEAQFTLSKLEDTLRRVEDSRTPIESSEIYDVVRARLFQQIDMQTAREVASAYFQFCRSDGWKDVLPAESRDAAYEALLLKAYPFHPSIIKVLYERWGSRPQFQLTRGTLRFLSHLLAHLWNSKQDDQAVGALIQLSDVDLAAEKIRAEVLDVTGTAWESIMGADIAASQKDDYAIGQRLDLEHGGLYTRFGLVEGLATSVFMFTHGGTQNKATPRADIRLAVARPEIPLPDLDQAFTDCKAKLYYYYEEDGGAIFKTEPNPNKVLADERANVNTDEARLQVERVVADVVGRSALFNVVRFGFLNSEAKEPGDVPDDAHLQMVVLPPRATISAGKIVGKTAELVTSIAENYGKRLRLARNMVLFLAPSSEPVAGAIERAMDWLAANRVKNDKDMMARFSESQRQTVLDRATAAENDTKDHVRKAYNTVLIPAAGAYETFELSYVPPSKKVLAQVEEELLTRRKLHKEFNPELLIGRWANLWPGTATVTTTQDLWNKFARQAGVPILTAVDVLQETIRQGISREIFAYGVLHDSGEDKLQAASYERVYLGAPDARDLMLTEISERTVLMRPDQVYVLFPPITMEEVAMLLRVPRQSVSAVFDLARGSLAVKGRVDKKSFLAAVAEGAKAGLFGYAQSDAPGALVVRGMGAEITSEQIEFSGVLVREDVPLPVTADEIVRILPEGAIIPVRSIYERAVAAYGADRASEQSVVIAVRNAVQESRYGYAASEHQPLQTGQQTVSLDGYVGHPTLALSEGQLIRLSGTVTQMALANMVKTAVNLGNLGESTIKIELQILFKGDVNEHAVNTAISELRNRVAGLEIDYIKGQGK